ncbi:MAG TPA: RnfABCDGE type electron transport complex subunit D [Blastocatellia bacterium]|nr:RnfABCDGE type electron transport complex subunit D [Blastocatellia bacterium]
MTTQDNWSKASRLGGLRRFAVAITILNILGHTVLGFEQSLAQPLAALAAAYGVEILLELVDARAGRRTPNFIGGVGKLVDFLLSAHITGLAVSMLVYSNERIWPIVFGTTVALASKSVLRVPTGGSSRHFFNPSNFGITMTLLLFPWVGIAPPYHFTEYLGRVGDLVLPAVIIISGTFLNARFTRKLPLIAAWVAGFTAQALIRSMVFDTPFVAGLVPITSVAFILYTFYMVTDPATTPAEPRSQVLFGLSVAATYGLLLFTHVVFGLFFALTIVCAVRGAGLYAKAYLAQKERAQLSTRPATRGAAVAKEF